MSAEGVFPKKPWTQSRMKALRKAIIAGGDSVDGLTYMDVYGWYFEALSVIVDKVEGLPLTGLDVSDVRVSSRVKTVSTLRDKLTRIPRMSIPSIHDVMGVRLAADMSLDTQDKVVGRIRDLFGRENTEVSDIRLHPHSGYRAVHVIVRIEGVFVEIQVRTLLQDLWANCFEETGDLFGRAIRYGGEPERDDYGLTRLLLGISQGIAALEESERGPLSVKTALSLTNARSQYVQGLRMTKESLKQLRVGDETK